MISAPVKMVPTFQKQADASIMPPQIRSPKAKEDPFFGTQNNISVSSHRNEEKSEMGFGKSDSHLREKQPKAEGVFRRVKDSPYKRSLCGRVIIEQGRAFGGILAERQANCRWNVTPISFRCRRCTFWTISDDCGAICRKFCIV